MCRLIIAFILVVALGQVARASSDANDCSAPRWSLNGADYDFCNNLPFLTPGNDTRVNLGLLITGPGAAVSAERAHGKTDAGTEDVQPTYGSVPFMLDALLGAGAGAGAGVSGGAGGGGGSGNEPGAGAAGDASAKAWTTMASKLGLSLPEGFPAEAGLPAHDLADGQGSRCQSNTPATALAFVEQLASDDAIPMDERRKLAGARLALLRTCTPTSEETAALVPAGISSPDGRSFADYLAGAAAFYGGDFDRAAARFTALQTAPRPWIAETARYMVARTALNKAQVTAFDEWGQRQENGRDAKALEAAKTAFAAYLAAYPTGRYAESAKGLMRKVYWLGSDDEMLASAYAEVLSRPAGSSGRRDLITEIDRKFVMDDPLPYGVEGLGVPEKRPAFGAERADLLAMIDLMWMRPASDGEGERDDLDLKSLGMQRPVFVDRPELHEYLLAAHYFYVEHQPAEALKHLPAADTDGAKAFDSVRFSSAMLRGLALEATGDQGGALRHWTTLVGAVKDPLQRVTVELALALNRSRAGQVDEVFVAGSPIRRPEIRGVLLSRLAGPELLRRQAKAADVAPEERATAGFTLLYKDLMRGHYASFADDFASVGGGSAKLPPPQVPIVSPWTEPDFAWFSGSLTDANVAPDLRYSCPDLASVAADLAANAKNAKALNCLGEFVRLHELEGAFIDQPLDADQLGAGPSRFDGPTFSRLDGYMTIIADEKAPPTDKAYALYRAIYCFASSGNDHCSGHQDVPQAQRKAWFQTLKSRYAETPWAKDTKYYW